MRWTASNITLLRRRLGWTTGDLSRRLGCQAHEVASWEKQRSQPSTEHQQQLDRLSLHVESCARMMAREPLADYVLRENKLGQVTTNELDQLFTPHGEDLNS